MVVIGMAFKLTAYYAHKGNTVAVLGVEVGVYLKDKPGHLIFAGLNKTGVRLAASGGGAYFKECFQQLLHPEIINCRTEKHRRQIPFQIFFHAKSIVNYLYRFGIVTQ